MRDHSEVAALMGEHPYMTPLDVFWQTVLLRTGGKNA
jgi:hypothetical protein